MVLMEDGQSKGEQKSHCQGRKNNTQSGGCTIKQQINDPLFKGDGAVETFFVESVIVGLTPSESTRGWRHNLVGLITLKWYVLFRWPPCSWPN